MISVFLIAFTAATLNFQLPQQPISSLPVESLQAQAAEALTNQVEISDLLGQADVASQQAVTQAAAVDPTSPDAVTDAALGLAVANQTYQFLNDASSASAEVLSIAGSAAPDDPNAATLAQVSLDQASYALMMASNNLGLLSEDSATTEINDFAMMMTDSPTMAGTPKKPKTVKGPDGTDVPAVPDGATGTPSDTGKGLTYPLAPKTPGLDPRVTQIRIMDPTNMYPDGYAVYMNKGGQTVNPKTGRTTTGKDDPWGHIPLPK